jgi:hypothetical protein
VKIRASQICLQESVVGENVRHIFTQSYQMFAREHLGILGLAFRIEGITVPPSSWPALLNLTISVIDCISHEPLKESGLSLCINSWNELPDAAGWITSIRQVEPAYWIAKTDFVKLQALEAFLYEYRLL